MADRLWKPCTVLFGATTIPTVGGVQVNMAPEFKFDNQADASIGPGRARLARVNPRITVSTNEFSEEILALAMHGTSTGGGVAKTTIKMNGYGPVGQADLIITTALEDGTPITLTYEDCQNVSDFSSTLGNADGDYGAVVPLAFAPKWKDDTDGFGNMVFDRTPS